MKLFVLTMKDGYPYSDVEGMSWFPAYRTYWRAAEKLKEVLRAGISDVHIREYERGQHRYEWDDENSHEDL